MMRQKIVEGWGTFGHVAVETQRISDFSALQLVLQERAQDQRALPFSS